MLYKNSFIHALNNFYLSPHVANINLYNNDNCLEFKQKKLDININSLIIEIG